MTEKAFQDFYPDSLSHCYGCGRLNTHGYQIKSYWEGEVSVCFFDPESFHTAIPGYVYGGLIASLIDCHSTGTASAAAYRSDGRPMDSLPPLRFLTASLHVDYLRPTPIDARLEIRGRVKEIKGEKWLSRAPCRLAARYVPGERWLPSRRRSASSKTEKLRRLPCPYS